MICTVLANDTKVVKQQIDKIPYEIESIALLNWEEHCVECSPPYCYNNCPLYLSRIDKKCIRIANGIEKNYEYIGPLGYGILCKFRKWAKLETRFYGKQISMADNIAYDRKFDRYSKVSLAIAKCLKVLSPTLKLYGANTFYRNKWFAKQQTYGTEFDYLYIKCYLKDKRSTQLQVHIDTDDRILFSEVYQLNIGENEISIPLKNILKLGCRIYITPLEDDDVTILFSWLDIIKVKTQLNDEKPADKIKVVAWDLDNTLWKGVLVNADHLQLNQEAVKTIKELDKRGILNTIVSKNDAEPAIAKLQEFGIVDYFLCPAINWGQKSNNLQAIAKRLNLGINSFAFVDDNVREREEVSRALQMVRVYADTEIGELLNKQEFNVPITEASAGRRLSYMQEVSRAEYLESFTDDYDDYLRSLEMILTMEHVDNTNKERCYELLSRSNQLNLSTNRYQIEEYERMLNDDNIMCYAFRCGDRFGDYGIVAFMSIELQEENAFIRDLVISCRIAKKKVENAIIISLRDVLIQKGVKFLYAKLIKTKKNGPLIEVFNELPFNITLDSDKFKEYYLELNDLPSKSNILEIICKNS